MMGILLVSFMLDQFICGAQSFYYSAYRYILGAFVPIMFIFHKIGYIKRILSKILMAIHMPLFYILECNKIITT